jgi:hypothetical protein
MNPNGEKFSWEAMPADKLVYVVYVTITGR